MNSENNRFYAWFLAARPRTLTASLSPVIVGCSLAWHDGAFYWLAAVLCVLVALFAQIASNFANDYFDFKKGADTEERIGPKRAVAQGWISPKEMLIATFIMLALGCLAGAALVVMTDWRLWFVGVAIAVCVLAYSAGPFPLAYKGLGDICVLLFYGVIPVCFTYYVQTFHISLLCLLLSIAIGLLGTNILIVNNYRDYYQDMAASKKTSIVRFGRKFGLFLYIFNQVVAFLLTLPLLLYCDIWVLALFGVWFVLSVLTTREMFIREGKELNATLGATARNLFIYAVALSLLFINS